MNTDVLRTEDKATHVRQTLRKAEILRGHSAFFDILKKGKRVRGTLFQCFYTKRETADDQPVVQVGFVVPKKVVPLAATRNRLKRLLRESYRKNKASLYEASRDKRLSFAIVVMIQKSTNENMRRLPYATVENEWNSLMSKIISSP
jgi:ribonuclease P protein component